MILTVKFYPHGPVVVAQYEDKDHRYLQAQGIKVKSQGRLPMMING